jgi:hypothetical protein
MTNSFKKKFQISFVLILLITIVNSIFLIKTSQPPEIQVFSWILWVVVAIWTGAESLTYYFGLLKKGTKWLTTMIVIRGIGLALTVLTYSYYALTSKLISIFVSYSEMINIGLKTYLLFWMIALISSVFYFINCIQLRKLNLAYAKQNTDNK